MATRDAELRALISERTHAGLARARAEGRRVARPSLSEEPELITRIRALRAEGRALQEICDLLNAEGVPTVRNAARWRPSALQSALGYKRGPGGTRRAPRARAEGWWLYRLYGHSGHLLYIGVTCDVERRWRQHTEKVWWVNVGRSRLQWLPTRRAAERAERLAIRKERPPMNRNGKLG